MVVASGAMQLAIQPRNSLPAAVPSARGKKLVKKAKKKSPVLVHSPVAAKKQRTENVGESIEEEEEPNRDDSGIQSNIGESIYEDFDN